MKKYFLSFLAAVCIAAVGISATNNSNNFKSSTAQILKDTVPSMQNGSTGSTDTAGGTLDATGNNGVNGSTMGNSNSGSTDTTGTGSTRGAKKYSHSKTSGKRNSTGSSNRDSSSSSSAMPPR